MATVDPASRSTPDPGADPGLPSRKLRVVGVVAVVLVVVDQLTKTAAQRYLANGPRELVGSLQLNLLYNTGVAFSQGSGKGVGPWVTVLALVVVVVVSLGATSRTRLGATASGLIAGGALGNLGDRAFRGDDGFLHGAVVDFIDLHWWPVFNVADAAIVIGAGLLVLASLRLPEDDGGRGDAAGAGRSRRRRATSATTGAATDDTAATVTPEPSVGEPGTAGPS